MKNLDKEAVEWLAEMDVLQPNLETRTMKIEITHYGNKASYEFEHEDVELDDLLYHLEQLIRLTGYSINGRLEIVNDEQ